MSGIPIVPVAAATSRRYEFNNWDKFTINLPFGRGCVVWGDPISIKRNASKKEMEEARKILEDKLLEAYEASKRRVE